MQATVYKSADCCTCYSFCPTFSWCWIFVVDGYCLCRGRCNMSPEVLYNICQCSFQQQEAKEDQFVFKSLVPDPVPAYNIMQMPEMYQDQLAKWSRSRGSFWMEDWSWRGGECKAKDFPSSICFLEVELNTVSDCWLNHVHLQNLIRFYQASPICLSKYLAHSYVTIKKVR